MLDELAPPAHAGAASPTTIEAGAEAEERAVELLLAHGYEVVERNYRCEIGELDIVAADGAVMVFVEVRSRANTEHGHAIESVNRKKQQKVSRVAEVYLAHRQPRYEEFRFDVVAITSDRARDITLYQDAWRGGL
ncbi:MAG: YraN family protein, partial [Deltaproteobacteria bacterium]|nr:YraN family protein [Deltaproteobacteria bacterium]